EATAWQAVPGSHGVVPGSVSAACRWLGSKVIINARSLDYSKACRTVKFYSRTEASGAPDFCENFQQVLTHVNFFVLSL
ncbi:MAG: hypothetical protein KAU22_10055, partial [Desulfuromonadales bacterium]|nr:hypothetical protein [Desulfuromonadales bacterium]